METIISTSAFCVIKHKLEVCAVTQALCFMMRLYQCQNQLAKTISALGLNYRSVQLPLSTTIMAEIG